MILFSSHFFVTLSCYCEVWLTRFKVRSETRCPNHLAGTNRYVSWVSLSTKRVKGWPNNNDPILLCGLLTLWQWVAFLDPCLNPLLCWASSKISWNENEVNSAIHLYATLHPVSSWREEKACSFYDHRHYNILPLWDFTCNNNIEYSPHLDGTWGQGRGNIMLLHSVHWMRDKSNGDTGRTNLKGCAG